MKYCYKHGSYHLDKRFPFNKAECVYGLDGVELCCPICYGADTEEYKQNIFHAKFRICKGCGYRTRDMIGKWRKDD